MWEALERGRRWRYDVINYIKIKKKTNVLYKLWAQHLDKELRLSPWQPYKT